MKNTFLIMLCTSVSIGALLAFKAEKVGVGRVYTINPSGICIIYTELFLTTVKPAVGPIVTLSTKYYQTKDADECLTLTTVYLDAI